MKNASIKIETSQVVFYELDVRDIKPSVKYCVIIYEDMIYRIWFYDIVISPETVSDFVKCSKIQYFSDITHILQYIQKSDTNSESPPINDQVNACIEKLEKLEHVVDQDIRPKLVFIIEQLKLAFMNTYHRGYSPDLLSVCVLWENTLSNLYKQIHNEGMLSIPSTRYIKKLTSALTIDTGLSEQTIKYLEARDIPENGEFASSLL